MAHRLRFLLDFFPRLRGNGNARLCKAACLLTITSETLEERFKNLTRLFPDVFDLKVIAFFVFRGGTNWFAGKAPALCRRLGRVCDYDSSTILLLLVYNGAVSALRLLLLIMFAAAVVGENANAVFVFHEIWTPYRPRLSCNVLTLGLASWGP